MTFAIPSDSDLSMILWSPLSSEEIRRLLGLVQLLISCYPTKFGQRYIQKVSLSQQEFTVCMRHMESRRREKDKTEAILFGGGKESESLCETESWVVPVPEAVFASELTQLFTKVHFTKDFQARKSPPVHKGWSSWGSPESNAHWVCCLYGVSMIVCPETWTIEASRLGWMPAGQWAG